MTKRMGSFFPQLFTNTPPERFTSSANTSDIFRHLSASVENGPVSEIEVPSTMGSLHEPTLACTRGASASSAAATRGIETLEGSAFIVISWTAGGGLPHGSRGDRGIQR